MNEDFVTYKTAKLANEKGIKIDINSFYAIDDSLFDEGSRFEVSECVCHTEDDYCTCNSGEEYEYSKKCIYAPTQSLLQKYLRNEKGFDIIISTHSMYKNVRAYSIYYAKFMDNEYCPMLAFDRMSDEYRFDTYEEALEVGLQKILKMI